MPQTGQQDNEYADRLAIHHARGRGAAMNPGNRHDGIRLHVLGETIDESLREHPSGVQVRTQVLVDDSRSIINEVNSPDLPMSWSINPYRGCEHGCVYCYARPTHENLGMSCGLDFETKIMAKMNAPELLPRELARKSWTGEPIMISGVTDPYQPIESKLQITKHIIEILVDCGNPFSIVTKNKLVLRDAETIAKLARKGAARVAVSVTTLDAKLSQVMEPRASSPTDRMRTIRELTDGGIDVMVMVAPVIPGINDREIPAILEACSKAGAIAAGWVMLRLPWQLKSLFTDWLARHFPDRSAKVENHIRDMRGGNLYDARFCTRQRGEGPLAEQIRNSFDVFVKRYGLDRDLPALTSEYFQRPSLDGQLGLFDARM